MRKHNFIFVAIMAIAMLTSCVSSKKIVYFQGAEEVYSHAQVIAQQYELRIKPADNLVIKISCTNPELLQVFANDIMMGTNGSSNTSMTGVNGAVNNIYGYTVNRSGEIILPLVGAVRVGGMTMEEAGIAIQNAVRNANLISDPDVTVRLLNARVAVLGSVQRPAVVSLTSERNTIVDVLAQCGDIADDGLKTNVKLFREVNGVRTMYVLDLTDVDVLNSPAYYVQQNDMIYVEPNKSKNIKNSAFYTFLSAGASLIGIASSILSIVVVSKAL